jgi:hypothetical protein
MYVHAGRIVGSEAVHVRYRWVHGGLMRTRDVDQIDLDCCPDDNVADIPCQIIGLVIKDASGDNKSDSGGANAASVSKSIN